MSSTLRIPILRTQPQRRITGRQTTWINPRTCLTPCWACLQAHYRWIQGAWSGKELKHLLLDKEAIATALQAQPAACRENCDLRPLSNILFGRVVQVKISLNNDLSHRWLLLQPLEWTSRFVRSQMDHKIEAVKTGRTWSMSAQFLQSLSRRSSRFCNSTQTMAKVAIKVLAQIKLEEIKVRALPNYNYKVNPRWPNNNNSSFRFSSNHLFPKSAAMGSIQRVMDRVKS